MVRFYILSGASLCMKPISHSLANHSRISPDDLAEKEKTHKIIRNLTLVLIVKYLLLGSIRHCTLDWIIMI